MSIKDILEDAGHESRVLKGEATKDTSFSSEHTFADAQTALKEFTQAKARLFDVDAWSDLPGISASFALYDSAGIRKPAEPPQTGDFIRIDLPGPLPENWVQVTDVRAAEQVAEFTVHPSHDPRKQSEGEPQKTEHFFRKEASSTFRVELAGNRIIAREIGKNEGINNQGTEAGERAVVNTLVAEGGWALFQERQWKKLTDYLVHLA